MVYRTCLMHAALEARRRYGRLGWSAPFSYGRAELRMALQHWMEFGAGVYEERMVAAYPPSNGTEDAAIASPTQSRSASPTGSPRGAEAALAAAATSAAAPAAMELKRKQASATLEQYVNVLALYVYGGRLESLCDRQRARMPLTDVRGGLAF